jgi:hypothetical protein
MTNLTIRRFEFQYLAGMVLLHLSSYLGEKGIERRKRGRKGERWKRKIR